MRVKSSFFIILAVFFALQLTAYNTNAQDKSSNIYNQKRSSSIINADILTSRTFSAVSLIDRLLKFPDVLYVEPNHIISGSAVPIDKNFHKEWGLRNNESRSKVLSTILHQRAISNSFNSIQGTLTPTLFFDGAGDSRFANIWLGQPVIDSLGRILVTGTDTTVSCSFGSCSRLFSISPSGALNWQQTEIGSGSLGGDSILVGPNDRVYFFNRTSIFAFDSSGNSVPGWAVSINDVPFLNAPPVVDQTSGTVFARYGNGSSAAVVAFNPNGTQKFRKDYSNGNISGANLVQGSLGNLYTYIQFEGLVSLDKTNGNQLCASPLADAGRLVGSVDGVFNSNSAGAFLANANCNTSLIYPSPARFVTLITYGEDKVFGIDYQLGASDFRLMALSKDGTFLWRNSEILYSRLPSYKNGVLYVLGQHLTDGNKQKLFLLNPSSGEIINSLETSPYCSSCWVSVANDGTIYLNEFTNTKIYKIAPSLPTNQTPTAGFTMTNGSQSATEGQTLTVTAPTSPVFISFSAARSSDTDGTVTAWEWKIDGNNVSTASGFTYGLNHGSHTVALTVTDNQGGTSSVVTGQINISQTSNLVCPPPDTSFAFYSVSPLIPDDNEPLGNRKPLILIHGNHGNEDADGFDLISLPNRDYFLQFLNFFYKQKLNSKYKIYRFHYVSDRFSVREIARALRNEVEQKMCDDPSFDTKFVIITHSMGGLIARSYMNEYEHNSGKFSGQKAGERVLKLITLGTPHHGSPGANNESLDGLASSVLWRGVLETLSFYYWKIDGAGNIFTFLSHDIPNRSDIRWDNFDNIFPSTNSDINLWLKGLNDRETFSSKMNVYYGYINLDDPKRRKLIKDFRVSRLSPGAITIPIADAKFKKDEHGQLLGANIVMDYGLSYPFSFNDGLVPIESGSFQFSSVGKRVSCEGYDHKDIRDGKNGKCSSKKTLFDSIKEDLESIP